MKFLLLGLFTISYFLFPAQSSAIYDPRTLPNNKMGVHILAPSELESAAKLVNSQGGDWGYVTVPIQPEDRDQETWQNFMHKCLELHLIPIIRITTIPQGGTWESANDSDLVDFANFLNELDWPIENRYIILFNEVNRASEWGGVVDPHKYSSIIKNAYTIFKERSEDFFLLGPALDNALPDSTSSLSFTSFTRQMKTADPLIWSYFDGWASHSYPNPAFTASPHKTGLQSIVGYSSEMSLLGISPKPVFITETGWDQSKLNGDTIALNWSTAWNKWQKDQNVVAVTPFVLQGGDQFATFSLLKDNGEYSSSGQSIWNLPKTAGRPTLAERSSPAPQNKSGTASDWITPFFTSSHSLMRLENIFRVILGLPIKSSATLKDLELSVELAQTPKQWEKGLSGRQSLGMLDGMIFIFPYSHIPVFWMKDMQFPIDIVWLQDGVVVDITYSAPVATTAVLPTYSPKTAVNMVLETGAGWAAKHNIVRGDILTIHNN